MRNAPLFPNENKPPRTEESRLELVEGATLECQNALNDGIISKEIFDRLSRAIEDPSQNIDYVFDEINTRRRVKGVLPLALQLGIFTQEQFDTFNDPNVSASGLLLVLNNRRLIKELTIEGKVN